MFLTGFDAPTLNTLFVDKNLRYHGLIQAFSRTNRIYDATKTFGNIVTFRDLEKHTIDAIKLFGDENTANVVLEKSYREYLEGFKDIATGEARRGYIDIVKELNDKFPDTDNIVTEQDKKEFVKLFGEYLRVENILQNFDEFTTLKAFQTIDTVNPVAIEAFKNDYFVTDDDIAKMQNLLLKSQEINLDYILELIFENNKKKMDKSALIDEIRRVIRSSVGNRAKEGLIVDFIHDADLDAVSDKTEIIKAFFEYAQTRLKKEASDLIASENLNEREAKYYMEISLKREYASENGTDFNNILPKMSPLNPLYLAKKHKVFEKIAAFVEKFKGVGRQL